VKFFVTGGAGFIGRSLVNFLLSLGHQVTIFDNFQNSSKEKISFLLEKGANFVEGDITNYNDIQSSLNNFDFVIHLAAQIDVKKSVLDPHQTFEINVAGTINLLKVCILNNIKNFIAASSAAVYGESENLPITEKSKILPISPYGESKTEMEKQIQQHANQNNLNCICLRLFNIYGKGQTDTYAAVITKFKTNIEKNQPLTIFGDGSNTRDFIYIDDVIQAFQRAIEKIDGKRGKCYNIGSGKSTSIKELANLMLSITGKNLEIRYTDPREGDIIHSQTSIVLAKNDLEFSPKISLEDGLRRLFD